MNKNHMASLFLTVTLLGACGNSISEEKEAQSVGATQTSVAPNPPSVTKDAVAAPVDGAPNSPTSMEESIAKIKKGISGALSSYYNSNGISKNASLPQGDTIPWYFEDGTIGGFLISTGEVSDKGCPVFNHAMQDVTKEMLGMKENKESTYSFEICP